MSPFPLVDLQAPFDQRHQVASVFQVAVLMDSPKSSAASASSSSVVSVHSEADPSRPRACRNSSGMMSPAQRVRPFPAYLETELATRRGPVRMRETRATLRKSRADQGL